MAPTLSAAQALVLYSVAAAAALLLSPPAVVAQLTPNFYDKICPLALPTIRRVVSQAVNAEPRMGASLLRLHFHDCFVNGCDGSVLLDDTTRFTGEKTAVPNLNSLRGFDVVDKIKSEVDRVCKRSVVSCADVLAVAARDSVSIVSILHFLYNHANNIPRVHVNKLGGSTFTYQVPVGRRDSRTASKNAATNGLPPPFFSFNQLLANFRSHGLGLTDLVALSGAHTIGLARCTTFRSRIYNDTNIQTDLASSLRRNCPQSGGDNNLQPLDGTPAGFDTQYFGSLVRNKGLLHSDQELFGRGNSASDGLVSLYSGNPAKFAADFAASMVRMGNMRPLTGSNGEIRTNCRKIN
ncbi:unnamed protein product [Linum tenue]|uniref:Peroxidase n=1 Tax=Linum tenue TaxID=586396 RepID=A0AAV0IS83_9ROSI|nr:unnamed protein product [Linum tenue]